MAHNNRIASAKEEIKMHQQNIDAIDAQIKALENQSRTKLVKDSLTTLFGQKRYEIQRIKRIREDEAASHKMQKLGRGSLSGLMRKHWSIARQMKNVYHPDWSWSKARKEVAKKRRGKKSKISDVEWRNPSP